VFPRVDTPRLTMTALWRWAVSDNRLSLAERYASCRKDRNGLPTAALMPVVAACQS
jgi:hypothetical protein